MIVTPHHVIPDPTGPGPTPPATAWAGNASAAPEVGPGGLVQTGGPGGFHVPLDLLALALAITLLAGIAAYLLLYATSESQARAWRGSRPPRPPREVGPYAYPGSKGLLRRVYLALLDALRARGVVAPRGYTPSEVAGLASSRGYPQALRVARVYNEYIYGPREPPREAVEEARRALEEVEGSA